VYNNRWFKGLATVALMGLVVFTSGAKAADVSSAASSPVLSNCQAALRQGAGTVMPSRLSDRELCYRLTQIQASGSSAAGLLAAIASRGGFTVNLASWGDAGAGRPLNSAPLLFKAGSWQDEGARTAVWGDAGVARPLAAAPLSASAGWADAGAGGR
jgi:hypothetical protein